MKIRKLTPGETWRLMGFTDVYFNKTSKICTETNHYHKLVIKL